MIGKPVPADTGTGFSCQMIFEKYLLLESNQLYTQHKLFEKIKIIVAERGILLYNHTNIMRGYRGTVPV
jgi:hypothetical protein